MSDGPYKSLPLRPCWKKVAQFAENSSFSVEEICGAVSPALVQDWSEDQTGTVATAICAIFNDEQGSLFRGDKTTQLEALLPLAAGSGFGQVMIDCAIHSAAGGKSGIEAALQATENALRIWASRHTRPIEEHYCEKLDAPRAYQVRVRIEDGFAATPFQALARQLLGLDAQPLPRRPVKQTGLDDGARL